MKQARRQKLAHGGEFYDGAGIMWHSRLPRHESGWDGMGCSWGWRTMRYAQWLLYWLRLGAAVCVLVLVVRQGFPFYFFLFFFNFLSPGFFFGNVI